MAKNVTAAKRGWSYNKAEGTMGFFVDGYLREYWTGRTGQHVTLPPFYEGQAGWTNMAIPDVYVLDSTQLHPEGSKMEDGEKVFHYGFVDSTSTSTRAMGGMMNRAEAQAVTAKAVVHAVGTTAIVTQDTSSAVNLWAGGDFMPRVHPYSHYRVLSSTANDGTNVTLTLARGLLTQMESAEDGFLNQNMYSKMSSQLPPGGATDLSAVGINLVTAAASNWMWVQTWGPCYVSGGDERLGAAGSRREAYINQDGTLITPATVDQRQSIGYAINESGTTATWYVYLMLAR